MRILILFAHPRLEQSRVQHRLLKAVQNLSYVTVHDLYETSPDFLFDIKQEQQLLTDHDIIIFQHPFYWYSTPAIVKEWQDVVLSHGFAYGDNGVALKDKITFNVMSVIGREENYSHSGYQHFSVRELLSPFEQTARFCGMKYCPPFVVHSKLSVTDEKIKQQAHNYFQLLEALHENKINADDLTSLTYLNQWQSEA